MENFFYETRSKLHKNPELALEEYETARYIRNFLDNGITWSRNILGCKQLFMDVTQQNEFYKMLLT